MATLLNHKMQASLSIGKDVARGRAHLEQLAIPQLVKIEANKEIEKNIERVMANIELNDDKDLVDNESMFFGHWLHSLLTRI